MPTDEKKKEFMRGNAENKEWQNGEMGWIFQRDTEPWRSDRPNYRKSSNSTEDTIWFKYM